MLETQGGGATLTDGVLSDRFGVEAPRWRMAVPAAGAAHGLVVALHGFGGSADDTFNLGFADAVASSRMAVVSVDGGGTYWHRRRDGSDTGAMVRDELIPMALRASGLPARSSVTLLGWSMGGFGALFIADELGPSRVSGVVAASAALWLRGSETPARAYDGRSDFDSHSIFNRLALLRGIPVRLDCGTSDPSSGQPGARAATARGRDALHRRWSRRRLLERQRRGRDDVGGSPDLTVRGARRWPGLSGWPASALRREHRRRRRQRAPSRSSVPGPPTCTCASITVTVPAAGST